MVWLSALTPHVGPSTRGAKPPYQIKKNFPQKISPRNIPSLFVFLPRSSSSHLSSCGCRAARRRRCRSGAAGGATRQQKCCAPAPSSWPGNVFHSLIHQGRSIRFCLFVCTCTPWGVRIGGAKKPRWSPPNFTAAARKARAAAPSGRSYSGRRLVAKAGTVSFGKDRNVAIPKFQAFEEDSNFWTDHFWLRPLNRFQKLRIFGWGSFYTFRKVATPALETTGSSY